MKASAIATCQLGTMFARCRSPGEHVCQYCGRRFCQSHSYFLGEVDAVCGRKLCRLKRDDLLHHDLYRKRVGERNSAGLCGLEDCSKPHPGFQCSLCEGRFCGHHLRDTQYVFRDGWSVVERPVSLCPHCWGRRKIWRRVR